MDPKKEMYRKRGAILAGNLLIIVTAGRRRCKKRWSWCRTALLLAGAEPCLPNRLG